MSNQDQLNLIADIKEHVTYLKEIGVTDMNVELSALTAVAGTKVSVDAPRSPTPENLRSEIPDMKLEIPVKKAERPKAGSRLASLPSLKDLAPGRTGGKTMSKEVPEIQKPVAEAATSVIEVVSDLADPTETIEQIRAEIGPDCTRCKLSQLGRSKVVNSVGNFNADLMFVGEAPGADEDAQGEPFVGRAGRLLTDIMKAIGFKREDVFIGNINRCRPPGNRAPEPDESVVCKPFLKREIAVVRPKVIVVLGATAAQNLLETKTPIGKLRGHFHEYLGTKVMPTFHPAYLLRDPHKKREVWDDMKKVRDYLNAG